MPPSRTSPRRAELATRLRELRTAAFPTARRFADAVGWAKARVSKLETGQQRPTEDDLATWVAAVAAPPGVLAELRRLAELADREYTDFREMYREARGESTQDRFGRLEAEAVLIEHYNPSMVPGLLQTGQYTRELLSAPASTPLVDATPEQIEQMITGRARRQEVLYAPGKTVRVVVGEGALRTWFGSRETLLAQLDRLVSLSDLTTVEFGVLPFGSPHPTMPLSGWTMQDRSRVFLESLTGLSEIVAPHEVAAYSKALDLIWEVALTGPDAVALIQRVAAGLR